MVLLYDIIALFFFFDVFVFVFVTVSSKFNVCLLMFVFFSVKFNFVRNRFLALFNSLQENNFYSGHMQLLVEKTNYFVSLRRIQLVSIGAFRPEQSSI